MNGSSILVLGVAYKKDVDDLRESPALEIISLLQEKGAAVSFHDPFCGVIADDGHTPLANLPLHSQPLTDELLETVDAVVVVTDHSGVDYARVGEKAALVVDTRGVMRDPGRRVVGLSRRVVVQVPRLVPAA